MTFEAQVVLTLAVVCSLQVHRLALPRQEVSGVERDLEQTVLVDCLNWCFGAQSSLESLLLCWLLLPAERGYELWRQGDS